MCSVMYLKTLPVEKNAASLLHICSRIDMVLGETVQGISSGRHEHKRGRFFCS